MTETDNLPAWTGRPGAYEVWFLTTTDPATGDGYWIRSTLFAPRTGPSSAGVWFARFDRSESSENLGIHRTCAEWSVQRDGFRVVIGDAEMRSGVARGSVQGGGHEARWDLEYSTGQPTYRPLPEPLYRLPIGPTKPYSVNVDTRVFGSIAVDGRTFEISDAPGQQGHLFGTAHAQRWAWAHCADFLDERAVVHALSARGRWGPFATPFLTVVGLRWEDRWIRLWKMSPRSDFGLGTWRVRLANRQYRLTGRVEAPARSMIRARYQDPAGSVRYCHNSEIASCRLALFERKGGSYEEVALLESRGTTHAEWAGRTPALAVEREFVEVGA